MSLRIPFYLCLLLFAACSTTRKKMVPNAPYPNQVGDIAADSLLDDPTFRACRESNIPQYYNIKSGYEGEKPAIERYFKQSFRKDKAFEHENGYITIRFVVNCNGQTGRFRVQEMGRDYRPKKFPAPLTAQLLQLTKAMDGWLPGMSNSIPYDYYQYLTFTIVNGDIERITP